MTLQTMPMLTYDDALAKLLAKVARRDAAAVSLMDSLGLVIAEDIAAEHPLPPFDNSAMDGYAVRFVDVQDASPETPVRLPIIGEVSAGSTSTVPLGPGSAIRIMTGAQMPIGADSIVPIEDTDAEGEFVTIREAVRVGQYVRPAGGDVAAGTIVVTAESQIHARNIGLVASAGHARVHVYPRPTVAIISTGDELIEPGAPLLAGQIYNSNGYALAAQVQEAGGIVAHRLHVRDTETALGEAFDQCRHCDIIITSGGVSVGAYDYVKAVFSERGQLEFWRVAIRPGKPFAFGQWDKTLFFGLPGNPVSSMVTFEIFVRPSIRKLLGHEDLLRPTVTATLLTNLSHEPGRRDFQRAIVTREPSGYAARLTGAQGSGMLTSMALANALIIIPEETETISAGETAIAILLD